jgi:two-component system chemotaxis sensor kinase CheA
VELEELFEISFDEIDEGSALGASAVTERGLAWSEHEAVGLFLDELAIAARRYESTDGGREVSDQERQEAGRRIVALSEMALERLGRADTVQLLDVFRDLQDRIVSYAAAQGKAVKFEVSGGGALVQTTIAEAMVDPVLHVVRNSVRHGVEPREVRVAAGKPPEGTIRVVVGRVDGTLAVEIADDGAGIDEEAIRSRSGDNERSLLDIISSSGFTTSDRADRESGRGVGLDVVVHSIRNLLGGEILLENRLGVGATFRLVVPAGSRLIRVVIADSSDGIIAIPEALILQRPVLNSRRVKRDSFGMLFYDYHGTMLPLLTPFGAVPEGQPLLETDRVFYAVLLDAGRLRSVVVVDEILAEEAVMRNRSNPRRVYSSGLGRDVPLIFPAVDHHGDIRRRR